MGTHRFFILALVVWLAAACTLAKPPRTEMVSPTRVVVRTATPPATSVGPVEIEPTSTRTVRTPANTPQVRITGTIRPSPTVDPLACLPDNPGQTGLVSWVIDGETFVIDIGGRRETVRLLGIDAVPLTKDITRSMLDQRVVRLLPDGPTRDAQGHFLRYVLYLDGRFINDELLRSGAARLDIDAEGLACGAQFATAEEFATQEGLGLWGYLAVAALPTSLQPTVSASLPPVLTVVAGTPTVPPSLTPTSITTISPSSTYPPTVTQGSPNIPPAPTNTVQSTPAVTPTSTATQPVATGTVVGTGVQIVEIFFDGAQDPNEPDEYIEINNFDTSAVNLTDWWIYTDYEGEFFFFPDFSLPAGQSCRIYSNQVQADSCVADSFRTYFEVWNNQGDCGYLYDSDFEERSSFCYGEIP